MRTREVRRQGRRVCMVVHGPYPVGEPRVAREAAAALDAGYEVDVVATRRRGEQPFETLGKLRVFRLPVERRRGAGVLGTVFEYSAFAAFAAWLVARQDRYRQYAVVQVHNPPDFLVAAALVPRLRGARLLFDVHDLARDMFAMRFGGRRFARLLDSGLALVERLALLMADGIITVHEPYRQALISRGAVAAKTAVVMNTVDEALLPETANGRFEREFRIVYHGTLTPPYGIHLLLEAFPLVLDAAPGARLEIYGEGDLLEMLRQRAEQLKIEPLVHFSDGYLDHREVLRRIVGAGVGVIPNLPTRLNTYALSSKLFEYVALGIPVVSANLPTIQHYFGPDALTYFTAGDAASLGQALVAVATDRDRAAQRARTAQATYDAYRWSRNAATYVRILGELALRQ